MQKTNEERPELNIEGNTSTHFKHMNTDSISNTKTKFHNDNLQHVVQKISLRQSEFLYVVC
jgi:hypothetical protein